MPTSIRELPIPGAVLFDLDGTLVDTVATRIGAWLEALAEAGLPTTDDDLAPLIGLDGNGWPVRSRRLPASRSTTRERRRSTAGRVRSTSD